MRKVQEGELRRYIDRNWPSISSSVGGYLIESEGIRLFSEIKGDYFHILGLPLIEILNYLTDAGLIEF